MVLLKKMNSAISNPLSSYSPPSPTPPTAIQPSAVSLHFSLSKPKNWAVFGASAFLISVPVFIQAPMVRALPWVSLALTLGWLWVSQELRARPRTFIWGDLLLGFTWTWLAGSIYWGWLRWEPLVHLPVEAIPLPFVLWSLVRSVQKPQVGHWFYLGSLFGTAVTDLYFYLVDLIPYWRQLMRVEPSLSQPILQNAVLQMQTPWGGGCALVLLLVLVLVGVLPLRDNRLHRWAFGGAVLSTILVDGLFWLVATLA